MFGLIGNIGIVLAGAVAVILTKYYPHNIIDYSVTLVIAAGIIAMAIYRWMHVYVLTDPRYYDQSKKARKKKKAKLTMLESFKMILSSRYIGYIFLIVLSYGMVINLVEGPWKDKIRHLYPGTAEYMNFTGKFMLAMGFTCIVFMILGANMLRYFGWLISAMTTPVMVLVTGLIFFICVVFGQRMQDVILNPLFVSVIIGAVQNILSKATKYSLFDATREMTYIPIDEDLKTKGKAAIDVVGARLAKSSGAVLQSSLFFLFPSFAFDDIVPILMVVFVLICIVWLYAVKNLNIEYNKALAAAESESYYE
jgi:AAA family ATP:ADP antiporter